MNSSISRKKIRCKKCKFTTDWPAALGGHMRTKHGIMGTARSTVLHRLNQQVRGTYKCDQCPYECVSPSVLGRHKRFTHGIPGQSLAAKYRASKMNRDPMAAIGRINQDEDPQKEKTISNEERNEIYALGHIKGWLEAYAASIGVSGPSFTARVAKLFYSSAHR